MEGKFVVVSPATYSKFELIANANNVTVNEAIERVLSWYVIEGRNNETIKSR